MCTGLEKASGEYNINALNLFTAPKPALTKKVSLTWMSFCVAFELCAVACSLCLLPVDLQNGQSLQGYVNLYAHIACALMNSMTLRSIRTHVTRAWYHVECANLWLNRVEADVAGPDSRMHLPRHYMFFLRWTRVLAIFWTIFGIRFQFCHRAGIVVA